MRVITLVTKREIRASLMKKSFIIATALIVAVILIGSFVIDYFVNKDAAEVGQYTVGVSRSLEEMEPGLVASGAALGVTIETTPVSDRAAAEAALKDDAIDAYVSGEQGDMDLLFTSFPDPAIEQAVTSAAQTLALSSEIEALGGDPAVVAGVVQTSTPRLSFVEDVEAREGPQYFVAMISISLLLVTLMTSGTQIAMGVVEEKASRVVELLLATIKPSQLFAGKVLGSGIVGLAQVVVYGLAFAVAAAAADLFEGFDINLGSQIAMLVVWFLLGFSIFAVLWGSLASLVSRQEDIGSVTTPVTLLTLTPFYAAMFVVPTNPDGTAAQILSMIPFFAPFMMPMRTAFTSVPMWEQALSMGICLVTIPLLVWLAAKIYHRGVLHTGGRMSLREAFAQR